MTDAPKYPNGGDPRRRARLHLELYGRRRVVRALDRHLDAVDLDQDSARVCRIAAAEPAEVDWHEMGMDLTVRGRELLAEMQVAA